MNRLAGYTQIKLRNGQVVSLKFCNGSTELFAKHMGLNLLSEVETALQWQPTIAYRKAVRLYVYAAAVYVCLVQDKDVTFNEWSAAEWLDEVGVGPILSAIEAYSARDEVDETPASESAKDKTDKESKPVSLASFKFEALSRLNILPAQFYDLTQAETTALLKGVNDREVMAWKQTRRIATLIRNAHFTKPQTEAEFMPLPGDAVKKRGHMPPGVMMEILANMFPQMTRTIVTD